jgi:hypothetical protein
VELGTVDHAEKRLFSVYSFVSAGVFSDNIRTKISTDMKLKDKLVFIQALSCPLKVHLKDHSMQIPLLRGAPFCDVLKMPGP